MPLHKENKRGDEETKRKKNKQVRVKNGWKGEREKRKNMKGWERKGNEEVREGRENNGWKG